MPFTYSPIWFSPYPVSFTGISVFYSWITCFIKLTVWIRYLPKEYQPLGYRKNAYEALYNEYKNIMISCMMVIIRE